MIVYFNFVLTCHLYCVYSSEIWSTHPSLQEIISIQTHRQKQDDNQGMPSDVRLMKVSYDTEEFDSETDEDSRNDEADSEDSAPSSDNKFGLLGDEVTC